MPKLYVLHLPSSPIPPEILETLSSYLTEDRREHLKRLRLPEDALRSLAGQLIPIWYFRSMGYVKPNETLEFGRGHRGKPLLVEPKLDRKLDFNTSHDGRYVLFSAYPGEIGVDVMTHPTDPTELQDAIEDQLTLDERRQLLGKLSSEDRAKMLTVFWTVKEGYTKAIGEGIVFGLERIHVKEGNWAALRQERSWSGRVEFEVDGVGLSDKWGCEVGLLDGAGWAVHWSLNPESPTVPEGDKVEVNNLGWAEFVDFFESPKKALR